MSIKVTINIEVNKDEEYTLWPNGERKPSDESEVVINIKKQSEENEDKS